MVTGGGDDGSDTWHRKQHRTPRTYSRLDPTDPTTQQNLTSRTTSPSPFLVPLTTSLFPPPPTLTPLRPLQRSSRQPISIHPHGHPLDPPLFPLEPLFLPPRFLLLNLLLHPQRFRDLLGCNFFSQSDTSCNLDG
jgi:hypothetical protein